MTLPFKKRTLALCVSTWLLAGIFFGVTNPTRIASLWLVVGFILIVGVLYWVIRLAVTILGLYSKHIAAHKQRLVRISTLIGALLIAMQSAGQLTLKDLAVLLPLVVVGYLYASYGRRPLQNR